MSKKKKIPELKVFFDTSVLYTQVASDLLRNSISTLITGNSAHADLRTSWHLPSVVIGERRYQMQAKAREFLPTVHRLERLLGHNLNITEEILDLRVDEAINSQIENLNLSVVELDTQQVEWPAAIERSLKRNPPFDPGEREKGFRDYLIAESFIQLAEASPNTPSICLLAVVADDELLRKYLIERMVDRKNVRVLSSIDELESLINTLVSEVTEEFIAEIVPKISHFFFEKGVETSLFYKEGIANRIREEYGEELKKNPFAGTIRESGAWRISKPVFEKKAQQRTFWESRITVDAKIYRFESEHQSISFASGPSPSLGGISTLLNQPAGTLPTLRSMALDQPQDLGLLGNPPKRIDVAEGKTTFVVKWSVNSSQAKRLSSAKIESIEILGTKWSGE